MPRSQELEVLRTDLDTHLGALADQLLTYGEALRGMAAEGDAEETIEGRVHAEMAAHLAAVARHLNLLRGHLCPSCRMIEVVERVSFGDAGETRRRRPRPGGTRRAARARGGAKGRRGSRTTASLA